MQQPFPPPLPYQGFLPPPAPPKTTPEKIFTIVLIVLAILMALALADFVFLRATEKFDIPSGLFYYLIFSNSFFAISIIVYLIVRWRVSSLRRAATIAVSIILLFYLPLGTVVGIYGLLKVDRQLCT